MSDLMEQIRADLARRDACPRHQFPAQPEGYKIGARLRCRHCRSEMPLREAALYLRGYVAAGGVATDIIPDWPAGR